MMKAKEWAAELSESPDNRDETLKAFVEEMGSVAKLRGGSVSAVESAVREQRAKWQALCRECSSMALGTFESLLDKYGPEYRKAEEMARAQAARRGQGEERPGTGRRPGSQGRRGGRSFGR